MGADIQPYDPGLPDLHPDPAQWSHEDFVAAWEANDSRSAWNRAFLAAAYSGAHGDLQRYADAVGTGYQTMKNYRSVLKAYAAKVPTSVLFGVADALRGQQDRLELVSREQPWSVEEARLLAQSRRVPRPRTVVRGTVEPVQPPAGTNLPKPEPEPQASQPGEAEPGTNLPKEPDPEPETVPQVEDSVTATEKPARPDPEPQPGKPVPQPDPELQAAQRRIRALEEENTSLKERVKALEEANKTLTARLRNGSGGAVAGQPVTVPQTRDQAADGAHGEPGTASGPCAQCGQPGLPVLADGEARVLVDGEERVLVDGEERELFACDPCFRKARAKSQPLSRPEAAYAPAGAWDSVL